MFHTISVEQFREFSVERQVCSATHVNRGHKSLTVVVTPSAGLTYYCVRYKSNEPDSKEQVEELWEFAEAVEKYNTLPV